MTFKKLLTLQGQADATRILRVGDGATIPVDTNNRDYKEYLAWVALGNVIQDADPAPTPPTASETLAQERTDAIAKGASSLPYSKLVRAVLLVVLDEINLLRQRDVDRSADVAAATSLADLKTRWAARSALSDRTGAQLKTTVANKINAGTAD